MSEKQRFSPRKKEEQSKAEPEREEGPSSGGEASSIAGESHASLQKSSIERPKMDDKGLAPWTEEELERIEEGGRRLRSRIRKAHAIALGGVMKDLKSPPIRHDEELDPLKEQSEE